MEKVRSKQNNITRTITLNQNFQRIQTLLERILFQTGELIELDVKWDDVADKPQQFPPSLHTHSSADILGLEEVLNALDNAITLITAKVNQLEHSKLSSVSWEGIENKPTTFTPTTHSHTVAQVTGLQNALSSLANASHNHDVQDLNVSATVKDVLSSSDVNAIRTKLNIVNPVNSFTTNTTLYNGTSEVGEAKVFTTIVTAVDGAWTVDYSHVGFTEIFSISAIGQATGTALGDRNIACVANNGWSLTGCSGHLMSSNSAGLLAAMTLVNGSGKVHVTVYGK